MTDLVSIIIATYNGENYLAEQLDSILQQSWPALEIIVVDDGSTDRTLEILRQYAGRHPQISIHAHGQRLGYIKNFEKGALLATGKYISFCDQDDIWHPEKTARLMAAIGNKALAYCDDNLVNAKGESLHKKHSDLKKLQPFDNPLYFATDNCVGGHNLLMERSALHQAIPFPACMPHDLWCAFTASCTKGIAYVDEPLVQWRQHDRNVTTAAKTKAQKLDETRQRIATFRDYCPAKFEREKNVLTQLYKSYDSYALPNDFLRSYLFFRHKKYLLGMKKKNEFRKFLFCLKMFFKMRLHVA